MSRKESVSPGTLTLLVHSAFIHSRPVAEALSRLAGRSGVALHTTEDWREATDSAVVILVGVDEIWLHTVLENLSPQRQRIILLNGVTDRHYEHISTVLADQELHIRNSLAHLRSHGCNRPAFFGVQKNDTSDETKAAAFARMVSPRDVYGASGELDACFEEFFSRLACYDSVVCANDMIAVYLLGRCRERGVMIPQRLRLMGNGDYWLGAHVTPPLTTISYDPETLAAVTWRLCKDFLHFPRLSTAVMHIKGDLVERASTVAQEIGDEAVDVPLSSVVLPFEPSLFRVQVIDQVLSSCSAEKCTILRLLAQGLCYEEIAVQLRLSCDTVKYHIKKLYKRLDIHSRHDLAAIIRYYGIRF